MSGAALSGSMGLGGEQDSLEEIKVRVCPMVSCCDYEMPKQYLEAMHKRQ